MFAKISKTNVLLMLWDVVASLVSTVIAAYATHTADDVFAYVNIGFTMGLMAVLMVVVFFLFRIYQNIWEYASGREVIYLLVATVVATLVGAIAQYATGYRLPLSVYGVDWVVFLLCTLGSRFGVRTLYQRKRVSERRPPRSNRLRTLVVGAGETGSYVIRRMDNGDYAMQGLPVCAVDDDPKKQGLRINNVKVVGTITQIPEVVEQFKITQIVMAIPSASEVERKRIYDICVTTGCNLLTLPNVRDLSMDELADVQLRQVDLADLLSRDEYKLDVEAVSGYLRGKTVLITGGGGSIGSELARQVATIDPARLIIFDVYENTTYELEVELKAKFPALDLHSEIGSIQDAQTVDELFARYHPDVVFHAAAHKHVPLMESNLREAVLNNVVGTYHLLCATARYACGHFVFISTDKAVNPTSVMGATKRVCELLCQDFAQHTSTKICAVRFGNVLGSHGSVIPFFTKQIAEGGPVTVTHPDITRYFMTIPESVSLVLTAAAMAESGEIFILKMGMPVKIDDMARKLIRLSGHVPDKDIKIVYTGLRPGEKLYEELLQTGEDTTPTKVPDILISTLKPEGSFHSEQAVREFWQAAEQLSKGSAKGNPALASESDTAQVIAYSAEEISALRALIKKYVPNYHPEDAG